MSSNPLAQLLDADLNSDKNRAVIRCLLILVGKAVSYVFPARATACYSALVTGFALTFIPIAKNAPVRLTLALTLSGAGLVAVAAHELDELQDDIDEARERKVQDRQLRQYAETEAKSKQAETNLLRHSYELDKSLPPELQQALLPASNESQTQEKMLQQTDDDCAAFDAAVSAAENKQQNKEQQTTTTETVIALSPSPLRCSR